MHLAPRKLVLAHETDIELVRAGRVVELGRAELLNHRDLVVDSERCNERDDDTADEILVVAGVAGRVPGVERLGVGSPLVVLQPVAGTTEVDGVATAGEAAVGLGGGTRALRGIRGITAPCRLISKRCVGGTYKILTALFAVLHTCSRIAELRALVQAGLHRVVRWPEVLVGEDTLGTRLPVTYISVGDASSWFAPLTASILDRPSVQEDPSSTRSGPGARSRSLKRTH